MTLKILDCTIRDGGHLNGWNFEEDCVRASYYAAVKCGIDYFEIGYRFSKPKEEWGRFARCEDTYLKQLLNPVPSCKISVMIDAGKGSSADFGPCKEELTPIKAVRVATYSYDLPKALNECIKLHEMGYETFLNLMVISEFKDEHYQILKNWPHKDILQCVTFADSFGSFVPDDITRYIKLLKSLGFEKTGFHSHNNLQLAFANSLKAVEEGAYCVDASIYGMGRGSGNLPIEIFTGYLTKIKKGNYNPVAYIDVISRFYMDLMAKTPWGYRIQSLIGGLKNVHPYYIDDLFKQNLFTINEIWTAAELVKKNCPTSFSTKELNSVLEDKFVHYNDAAIRSQINIIPEPDAFIQGQPQYKDILKGKKVLVLASGPSIKKYQKQIEDFIKQENCAVIATNYVCTGYKPQYHLFAERSQFLRNAKTVSKEAVVIVPSFFGKELPQTNCPHNKIMYFDIAACDNADTPVLEGGKQLCMGVNGGIAGIYAALQMGAAEIYAAGFDGFGKDGEILDLFYNRITTPEEKKARMTAYEKMGKDLVRLNKVMEQKSIPFCIITPTSHDNFYRNLLED